jgi:segregation and condensation protein B
VAPPREQECVSGISALLFQYFAPGKRGKRHARRPSIRYDTEGTDYRMSLKSKLEAVIYAAEEPVTLAQLAALFAEEALALKAEQSAAAAETGETAPAAAPLPLLDETAENEAAEAEEPAAETAEPVAESEPGPETAAETEGEPPAEGASAPQAEAAAQLEAKRQARQRDREVRAILRGLLDELIAQYAADDRGVEIREIAGGYRMATKPEYHDAVRLFVKSLKPAMKLSLPALETLAVIAYKQPVTAPEVNEIRGVDSSGVFGSLLARKLIATAGRKPVIGRPILYKTTREFLLRFGLKDVSELPSMEEFEKMAALELEESEAEAAAQPAEPELDLNMNEEAGETPEMGAEPTAEPADEPAEIENLPHAEEEK